MGRNFTLGGLLAVIVILAVGAALVLPQIRASRRNDNVHRAAAAVRMLMAVEEDFRSNDRDENRVNDFWTADIYGLYGLVTSARPDGIRLIEREIALADAASNTIAYRALPRPDGAPYGNHLFRRFDGYEYVVDGQRTSLLNDTDGSGARIHDRQRYAFMACPVSLQAGSVMYMAEVGSCNWKYNLGPTYRVTFTPMGPRGDSSSSITGTGEPQLDNGRLLPEHPGVIGFGRYD